MKQEYIEKIYAGWLAKIIGIRLGAPIEGWTYEKIRNVYGDADGYLVDYRKFFAADDDSNGPLFFLRALADRGDGFDLTAEDVGRALLNYAPFEHGFFWWGGYGISTEHTAYLNLRSGIPAPRSGTIGQNGSTVAEQIGGQIFIDTWGLVAPGNPDLAARYAKEAASVTHDRNGVYGGVFVATCISHAFDEPDVRKVIEKGLSYIPRDCEYARVARAVMAFHDAHPANWRDCFRYVFENLGYDKYPGSCHIIPNAAVMILALLYGDERFDDTLNICNLCGWDTDCNVGNVATIMGVICGLDAIDDRKWRRPINDLTICSSVMGSLNIQDIPSSAAYIAKLAWDVAGEALPEPWRTLLTSLVDGCHFEYPGSTHALRVRTEHSPFEPECDLRNTDEAAHSGNRSLKVVVKPLAQGSRAYLYKKTYYFPNEFHNSRYDPCFSPLIYPGQTIHASVMRPAYADTCSIRLYVHNATTGDVVTSDPTWLEPGVWMTLSFAVPPMDAALLDEAGIAFDMHDEQNVPMQLDCFVDDLYFDGTPNYRIDFARCSQERWNHLHTEISQFTRLKGLLYLEDGSLNLSCHDFGEAYTGRHDWQDYQATYTLTPQMGYWHMVNVRVQGAIRSYAAGFSGEGRLGLYKNDNGYRKLVDVDFAWVHGEQREITVSVRGAEIAVSVDGQERIRHEDTDRPYRTGAIGVSVRDGSHCNYGAICVH